MSRKGAKLRRHNTWLIVRAMVGMHYGWWGRMCHLEFFLLNSCWRSLKLELILLVFWFWAPLVGPFLAFWVTYLAKYLMFWSQSHPFGQLWEWKSSYVQRFNLSVLQNASFLKEEKKKRRKEKKNCNSAHTQSQNVHMVIFPVRRILCMFGVSKSLK